jgi:hypothetical protein
MSVDNNFLILVQKRENANKKEATPRQQKIYTTVLKKTWKLIETMIKQQQEKRSNTQKGDWEA